MKKAMKTSTLATLMALLWLSSCQREADKVLPGPTRHSPSVSELTLFLASTTGISPEEIVYEPTDSLFTLQQDMLLSRSEAEAYYRADQGARVDQRRGPYLVSDSYVVNMKVFIAADIPSSWQEAIRQAIPLWNSVSGTKVFFTITTSSTAAHVKVGTGYENSSWVARANLPLSSGKPGPVVTVNTYYNFLSSPTKINSIVHELGHTIGLHHTNLTAGTFIPGTPSVDPASVMHSTTHAWSGFTGGDVKAVQALYPSGSWVQLPGSGKDISVGANGSVYMVGGAAVSGGYGIHRWNGSGWTQLNGGAVRIAVDPQGVPWIVNNEDEIYKRNGNAWQRMPGAGTDIGVGANGSVYVIGAGSVSGGYGIHRWNSSGWWTQLNGGAKRIAVDPQGVPWIVNSEGKIYKRNGYVWQQLPGTARDIGVGADGSVYCTNTGSVTTGGYEVARWDGVAWRNIGGGGALQVSVNPQGKPWIVTNNGILARRQ